LNDLEKVAEKSTRGSFHLFIGNFLSEIFNAVGIIIVARLLGPTEMGIYGLSFVIPGVFTILTGLGLGQAMIRSLAIYQASSRW
jgi:O-antigen/teichoic acid export membrane protein